MIACLTVPFFAAAIERRDNSLFENTASNEPLPLDRASSQSGARNAKGLVIGGQPWEPQPVYAFSWEVARRGVKAGMSLRLAHFLSPDAQFTPANPSHYFGASGEITDILTDFTHLIEPEELWANKPMGTRTQRTSTYGQKPGSGFPSRSVVGAGRNPNWGVAFGRRLPARFTLDLESLPTAEALSLAREMGRTVRRYTHLAPAIGLAENKFVAQVAAALAQPNHARPVSPNEESRFLASKTIHFLPLDKESKRRLSLLGIRTLGQMIALPLDNIRAQLALDTQNEKIFSQVLHLVKGRTLGKIQIGDANPLFYLQPVALEKQEQVTYLFEPPVVDGRTLERVLDQAATELAGRLLTANQEGRTIHLVLELGFGECDYHYAKITRRHPTANPQLLAGSLHELLHQYRNQADINHNKANHEFNDGFISLGVGITDLVPAVLSQLSLFDPPKAINKTREILQNLLAKHGSGYFYRPEPADTNHPLLERRFQLQELGTE